jgi:ATP-binding cassette subfamily B protein/subfamily B ATP-binding cassette protein MsbA
MNQWWKKTGRYALGERRALVAIGCLILLDVALGLLNPWPLKLIVDNVVGGKPLPESLSWLGAVPGAAAPRGLLALLAAATVGLFLCRRLLNTFQLYIEAGAGSRMVYSLAADLFYHLQRRSLLLHYENQKGDLIKRVMSDTSCVRDLIMHVFVPSITSVVTLIGMFFIMLHLSPALAIFALVLCIPLAIVIRVVARPLAERRYDEQELQGQIYSHAEQTLSAIPIVQAFGREQHADDHFKHLARRTIGANLRYEMAGHRFKIATGAVSAIATACVMVVGGFAVRDGRLSVGSLLVLISYFLAVYSPLETLAYLTEGFGAAKAGARRVLEILEEDGTPIGDSPDAISLPARESARGADVRYENVSFGYKADRAALDDINFHAAPGEMVAIVGETGAGKSTLISMLLRLFDPRHGAVYINGHDLRDVTLESLRQNIAYMPQQPFLLPLSIVDNIAYGRPDATRNEIVAAAIAAKADDFIRELPHGYDTIIGERGVTLSVGQRQRVSLARALVKRSPILILDEPTSALDPATEAGIFNDICELFEGCTTFVIAHRLSTVRHVTTVMVMDHGRIVEIGSPDELIASRGLYYELHQAHFAPQSTGSAVNSCA